MTIFLFKWKVCYVALLFLHQCDARGLAEMDLRPAESTFWTCSLFQSTNETFEKCALMSVGGIPACSINSASVHNCRNCIKISYDMYTYTPIHARKYTNTQTHECLQTYMPTGRHAGICIHAYMHACIQTDKHAYRQTYRHTYIDT